MLLHRDRVWALIFLALSIAYGVEAQQIELYFGGEDETFTARTFPTALAWTGGIVSFLLLISPVDPDPRPRLREILNYDWLRVAALLLLMIAYGLTIQRIGFFLSTSLFLLAGYALLGERRPWMLFLASFPLVAVFQFLLQGLLGIYLADPFLARLGVTG